MAVMARQENPVELAQKLVSYLDSSNGETQPLFEAVESLRLGPKAEDAPFDLDEFETYIAKMDAALDDAWDTLEEDDGETPLMSEQYIDWSGDMDDAPEFRAESGASGLAWNILRSLTDALDAVEYAQDVLDAGEDVPTSDLAGDYGVYDSLADYLDYFHSQVRGMRQMASTLEQEA